MNRRLTTRPDLAPRRLGVAAVALIAATAVSGCGGDSDDTGSPDGSGTPEQSASETPGDPSSAGASDSPESSSSAAPTSPASGNVDVVVQAGRTALDQVGSGEVISIEHENQGDLWEVEVFTSDGTKHNIDVSGDGARVVGTPVTESEDADDVREHRMRLREAKLDYAKAVRAVARAQAGEVTEIGLDDKAGRSVWEADVTDGSGVKHTVAIDSATGEVVQDRVDD